MAFDVYTQTLTAAVVDDGTITFSYASGRVFGDYAAGGALLAVPTLQNVFTEDDDEIDVSYGASSIVVTYKGSTTIPKGTTVKFQATRDAADSVVDSLLTTTGVGAVTTEATTDVEEHGDGMFHITKLTLTDFAMGSSGDGANLALGASLYTFPAGAIMVEDSSIVGTINADISVQTDTPEVGLGTVVGAGVQATLGAVNAACENIGGPFAAASVNDGAVAGAGAASNTTGLYIAESGGLSHVVYLNAADGWADVTAAGPVTFTGVVTLKWRKIN
ncbi:hypothetical protein [Methyloceanibacter caenitepidi]|uniref:Uncharacterized protein n=1 Tax=Methyloceanibacter caenitepidi TaxID=1384459 RepID=A0A0A8K0R8_9HYPH|nr:hypothetical protein [Methyloceanibacter caenitepidi]BAQ16102.1 hypothetical protein GL4_0639 [Methyloceanibacter caenitepidi]